MSSEGNSGNNVPVAGIFLSKSFREWLLGPIFVDVGRGILLISVLGIVDNEEFVELFSFDWVDVFIR